MSIDTQERELIDASIRETAASAMERGARIIEASARLQKPPTLEDLAALFRGMATAIRERRSSL